MKIVSSLLLIAALALSASASAKTIAPKKSQFAQLSTDAKEFTQIFLSQTEICDVRVKETRNGITLSVKAEKKPVVYLDVANDSEIKGQGFDSDDSSYNHKYAVKGEGSVEFVHVDDAYDHLYIIKDGVKTDCELDY
jgi:hypothetical protein